MHGVCAPVFHCYACPLATFACPIGILANFSAFHIFPFFAVGIIIIAGAIFGGLICGWLCPFGFLQDLTAKVPTKKIPLPAWSGYFRYAVLLGLVILIPYFFGEQHPLFICAVCPAGALEAALPNMAKKAAAGQDVIFPNTLKIIITALFLLAIFFVQRPWCRLLCPLGAIFGLFNRFSAIFLKVKPSQCNSCQLCGNKYCDYGGHPETDPNPDNCIRCLDCTQCPSNALTLGTIFDKKPKSEDPSKIA